MLVRFFRNPVLLKVVGAVVALAFLLPLVRYRNVLRFVLPALVVILIFLFVRNRILKRRMKLTMLEEEYLKKRFYEN